MLLHSISETTENTPIFLNLKSVFMSKSGIPEKPHLRHLRSLAPLGSHVLHQKHYWDSSSSVLLYNDLICNKVNLTFKAPVSDVTSSNVKLWNKTKWKVRQIGAFFNALSQLLGLLPSPRAKVVSCFCIETYCTGSTACPTLRRCQYMQVILSSFAQYFVFSPPEKVGKKHTRAGALTPTWTWMI